MERTRTRRVKNASKSLESSLTLDAAEAVKLSQLEEVNEETLETKSCGSVGSDSLYDLSLEKLQDPMPDSASGSPSTKNKLVETDFEKVPSSLGSDMMVDPDGTSNASSLFNIVITDESNDEETDSCPVSPDVYLDTSSESSLFSVSKKPLPQYEIVENGSHKVDVAPNSPPGNTEFKTNSCGSHLKDSPCLNTTAKRPMKKPVTLPRRKADTLTLTPPITGSRPTIDLCTFSTDDPSKKEHPKIKPKRSSSAGILPVFSSPIIASDKDKPPVMPRKNLFSASTVEGTVPPVPKPRRKRNTVHTASPDKVSTKPPNSQRSPELKVNATAVSHLATFKKGVNEVNISWSAENSPVMHKKVITTELNNIKQLLRPLSTYSGDLIIPVNSHSRLMPKSASTDHLTTEASPLALRSAMPAIQMAPFEEDWQERFMPHKRRSKTMRHSAMRVRSHLIEVTGTSL